MFLIFFIFAGTLTGRAAVAFVARRYRKRRDMYMRYSRRKHPRWSPRRHRAAARWAAGMYTASNVAHGFPDLRHGAQQGWHAHRTASAEGRARHLKDIAEYRRRHAAALEEIRQHQEQQERSRRSEAERDATADADPRGAGGVATLTRTRRRTAANGNGRDPQADGDDVALVMPGDPIWVEGEPFLRRTREQRDRDLDALDAAWEHRGNGDDRTGYNNDPRVTRPSTATAGDGHSPEPTDAEIAAANARADWQAAFKANDQTAMDDAETRHRDARLRIRAERNGTDSGHPAGEPTNGSDPAATTAGEGMPTGTVGTGEVTGYESVIAATQEYKKLAEQEKDHAAAERQAAAALKASAENLVDSLQSHEIDSQTISEASDLLEAADGLDASAGEREAAADRLSNAAETLATGIESRHGGLAEAHKSAPVRAADREFYEG